VNNNLQIHKCFCRSPNVRASTTTYNIQFRSSFWFRKNKDHGRPLLEAEQECSVNGCRMTACVWWVYKLLKNENIKHQAWAGSCKRGRAGAACGPISLSMATTGWSNLCSSTSGIWGGNSRAIFRRMDGRNSQNMHATRPTTSNSSLRLLTQRWLRQSSTILMTTSIAPGNMIKAMNTRRKFWNTDSLR